MLKRIIAAGPAAALLQLALAAVSRGQLGTSPSSPAVARWQVTGIPAVNFDADEGFGYGAIVQAYRYGTGAGASPYTFTMQPTLFLTTRGRRDASVFFDAPHLLPDGWRLGAYVARLEQLALPYYGIGNETAHETSAEGAPNPYYYRYGREGVQLTSDVQRTIMPSLRVLIGAGTRTSNIDATPFDSGTTLLARQTGSTSVTNDRTAFVRGGLVWDTRDRETGPRSGQWIEALVQRASAVGGNANAFTRATGTARFYAPLTGRLTMAERVVVQNVWGAAPFYELSEIQGSYQETDGVGGAGSVRGLPKDRYIGKGMALANNEVRVHAADFSVAGRPSSLVLNGFVDAGRVWADGLAFSGMFSGLHASGGGGARLQYGPDFVVAVDVAHSRESTAPIYIGLGYLF